MNETVKPNQTRLFDYSDFRNEKSKDVINVFA